ncbi:MAG: cytochrome c biogenesis protein CcsA [Anaerolineaceae bacterium]|nr:cytochrome c biogenesis protein CcsA [Anaerolineaceae bacterium]
MTLNSLFGLSGFLGITAAFIICMSLIILSIAKRSKKSSNFDDTVYILLYTQTILLGLALLSLNLLLQRNAFEYSVVFNSIESAMSWYQRLGGMWSGQTSSLLFWSLIMSAAGLLAVSLARRFSYNLYIPSIVLIFECTLIFFILPDIFFNSPFERFWLLPSENITQALFQPLGAVLYIPADGQGMNPSLFHTAMLLHPPFLYMGLIGFFIPYSFALSSLIQNDHKTDWVKLIFPYVLATWISLTIGMFLGSWWAYTISGWGGYWGWDAVEISGLLPWMLSFGLIHSMRMHDRRRLDMKWVNLFSMGIIIFILLGILITRSGVLESVHAYTNGAMGPALTFLVTLHLLVVIYFAHKSSSYNNKEPAKQPASYSEKLIKWFNICLIVLVVLYFFGQTLPLSSQLILGEKRSFSQSNYETASGFPLLVLVILAALHPIAHQKDADENKFKRLLSALILISAFCPLILLVFSNANIYTLAGFWAAAFLLCSWLYAFGCRVLSPFITNFKQKEQVLKKMGLGSIVIHLGFAVMVFGILGVENFSSSYDVYLGEGDEATVGRFVIVGKNERDTINANNIVRSEFSVTVNSPIEPQRELTPVVEYYPKLDVFNARPAIYNNIFYDLKIVIHQLPDTMVEETGLYIAIFPLMSWIWVGGVLMVIGGLTTLFARKK